MVKRAVLVTGAGGGGSNNLINSLRASGLDLCIYGSNLAARFLAKSNADRNFLLPAATESDYIGSLAYLVERESIELVIPNSDREVRRISVERDKLPCHIFLPPVDTVEICQDKYKMYLELTRARLPIARSYQLNSYDDIEPAFEALAGSGDRFWVRIRRGSGSRGATWVKNAEQARAWISMWDELRGYSVDNFMISEFLPGRDYAFQSVWRDGELVVCKMCERLTYFFGANRLSGMSSTPETARTIRDDKALETIIKAIRTVCDRPHGNFSLDLKGDANGNMCITEFNVGRFCMITPIFDLTGQVNTAEVYVRTAFGEIMQIDDPIDIEEDMYLLRDLDTLPTIVSEAQLVELEATLVKVDGNRSIRQS